MELTYSTIGEYLVSRIPEFSESYEDHKKDQGEINPHVLFGDFTRFVIDTYRKSKEDTSAKALFERCLDFIEELMTSKEELLHELASVSFLENLWQAKDDYENIKKSLREESRKQMIIIDIH